MCNKREYEFYNGRCWMCNEDTKVRYKNLFIIGSEGTDLCWPCEKKVHQLIQEYRRAVHIKKRDEILKRKGKL